VQESLRAFQLNRLKRIDFILKKNFKKLLISFIVFSLILFCGLQSHAVSPAPKKPFGNNQSSSSIKNTNNKNSTIFKTKRPIRIVSNPFYGKSNREVVRSTPSIVSRSVEPQEKTSQPQTRDRRFSASLVTKDPAIRNRTVTVERGRSFIDILSSIGFNQRQINILLQRLSREASFSGVGARYGQQVILTEKIEGNRRKILSIKIPTDKFNIRVAKNQSGAVVITRDKRPDAPALAKSRFFHKKGIVRTNISSLGNSLGVPTAVTNKAIRVISSKINANAVRSGDSLELFYEYTYNNAGQQTGLRLLYLNLVSKAGRVEGFRFSPDGRDTGEFFDVNGNSFSKSMLSAPLKGRQKITSGFGYRRHPIFGRRMLHTGVDFGAPRGTPVYAAGDGTIDKIGRFGGYGNYIRIKHDGTWSTAYAHMNGFARGMGRWKRVVKGQQIGYVGNTGRSTGSHLHFELIKNGTAIDPLRAQLPLGGKKLLAGDLYKFRQEMRRVRNLINQNR
jgi:murein DD-endopeptidase MepM/ murein hydrolase activator NlpD